MKHLRWAAAAAVFAVVAGSVVAGGSQHRDILIGKTMTNAFFNSYAVAISNDNPAEIYLAEVDGILKGWTGGNPGWNADNGSNGVEPLDQGTQLFLEVTGFDSAFKAYDQVFNELHENGDMGEMGGHDLHVHYTWHIDTEDAGFDPERVGWAGAYNVVDLGTTAYQTAPDAVFFRPDATEGVLRGDADQDGVLTGFDVQAFWSVVSDPASATMQERAACDLNRDGMASADDATILMGMLKSVRLF